MHTAHVRKAFVHFDLPHNLKISSRAGIALGHASADSGVHNNASGFGGEISWGGAISADIEFRNVMLGAPFGWGM